MDKYEYVLNTLRKNFLISVVGIHYEDHRNDPSSPWGKLSQIYVAPCGVTISPAAVLQLRMLSLVPGLEPTRVDDFYDGAAEFRFGKLYFDEQIGAIPICQEIVISAAARLEKVQHVPIMQRTIVRLYPNEQMALGAYKHQNELRISRAEYHASLAPKTA